LVEFDVLVGFEFYNASEPFYSLGVLEWGPFNKKVQNRLRMIWEAGIWVIWKARNDHIVNNVIARWDELVEEIKVMSWRWLLGRYNAMACLFYEWSWDPRECLLR